MWSIIIIILLIKRKSDYGIQNVLYLSLAHYIFYGIFYMLMINNIVVKAVQFLDTHNSYGTSQGIVDEDNKEGKGNK